MKQTRWSLIILVLNLFTILCLIILAVQEKENGKLEEHLRITREIADYLQSPAFESRSEDRKQGAFDLIDAVILHKAYDDVVADTATNSSTIPIETHTLPFNRLSQNCEHGDTIVLDNGKAFFCDPPNTWNTITVKP